MSNNMLMLEQRAVIGRLFLDLAKLSYMDDDGLHGNHTDRLLVVWTCVVAQANGKMLTVSGIAKQIGVSRATVYRRISKLQEMGVLQITPDGVCVLRADYTNREVVLSRVNRMMTLIIKAATELSKVDKIGGT